MIRAGCRGLWPAWTALTELRFDVGHLRRELFELATITNDGHLQDGMVYFWLCLSWHISPLPRTLYGDCVLTQSPRDSDSSTCAFLLHNMAQAPRTHDANFAVVFKIE
jgi:hypothetical protein